MTMTYKPFIFVLFLFLLVGAGWYINRDLDLFGGGVPTQNATSTVSGAKPGDIIPIEGGQIEVLPSESASLPTPVLGKPLVFAASTDPQVKKVILAGVAKIEAEIKAGNTGYEYWSNLATYALQAGDYVRAVEIFTYLTLAYPTDPVAFLNRGNIYAYYLKDSVKAEADFKTALKNGPSDYQSNYQIVEFYLNVMKDRVKAQGVLTAARKNLSAGQVSDIEKLF